MPPNAQDGKAMIKAETKRLKALVAAKKEQELAASRRRAKLRASSARMGGTQQQAQPVDEEEMERRVEVKVYVARCREAKHCVCMRVHVCWMYVRCAGAQVFSSFFFFSFSLSAIVPRLMRVFGRPSQHTRTHTQLLLAV